MHTSGEERSFSRSRRASSEYISESVAPAATASGSRYSPRSSKIVGQRKAWLFFFFFFFFFFFGPPHERNHCCSVLVARCCCCEYGSGITLQLVVAAAWLRGSGYTHGTTVETS